MIASEPHIRQIMEAVGNQLSVDWTIFDTNAVNYLDARVTKIKGVTDTIKKQVRLAISDGITDGLSQRELTENIRGTFNWAKTRAETIARTELGGVLADSRIATFIDEGFTHIEWMSSLDAKVRDEHMIDGEIVKLGENFSNGMRWTFDADAPAGLVINCRCLDLPAKAPEG
jgi:SPP1 gp7 family putative phage head morphogenesis protein